jgi:hypothetical protein
MVRADVCRQGKISPDDGQSLREVFGDARQEKIVVCRSVGDAPPPPRQQRTIEDANGVWYGHKRSCSRLRCLRATMIAQRALSQRNGRHA